MKRLLILLVLLVGSLLLFSNPSFSEAQEEMSAQTATEATRGGTAAIPPPPELRDGIVTLTEGSPQDVYEYYVTYYGPQPIEYFVSKPHPPAVPPDVGAAIEDGLEWLAKQQNDEDKSYQWNHPDYGSWGLQNYPVGSTAFAVLKFEDHARRLGKDPFETNPASSTFYEYRLNVIKGWKYLHANMHHQVLTDQNGNNPEQYTDPSGFENDGIYFESPEDHRPEGRRPTYETGIVMMALQASGDPTERVPSSYLTFYEVLEDCVDYIAWAQTDSGSGQGGWDYEEHDSNINPNDIHTDNSISQWPVLGLMAAERWCIFAPDFVKSELAENWLPNTQDLTGTPANNDYYGAFGYTDKTDRRNIALTAAGIIELNYAGAGLSDLALRVEAAFKFIARDWTGDVTPSGDRFLNKGNYYAMYGVMKACVLYGIVILDPDGKKIDWQADYDRWLVGDQDTTSGPDYYGSWPPTLWSKGYRIRSTEWALLILQKVAPTWDEMHPRKAVDSAGNTIIVFMSNKTGSWEIYYREIEKVGDERIPQDDLLISDDHDCNDSVYPAVALDSLGNAHVVWADERDGPWGIYYTKVVRAAGQDSDGPDVSVSDVNFTYSYWARVPVDAVGKVITVDDGADTKYLEHPDITINSSDEVFIVWTQVPGTGYSQIYCQKQNTSYSGTALVNDFAISEFGWDSISPAIDAGPQPDNHIHIVWQRFDPSSGIGGRWEILYEKVYPGNLNPVLDNLEVTENDGWNSAKPDIAVDETGYAHIVWMDDRLLDPWHPDWGGTEPDIHPFRWEIFTTLIDQNGKFPWQEDPWDFSRDKRQSDMKLDSWYGSYTGFDLGDDHSMYPRIATHGDCCGDCQGTKDITWHDLRTGNWEVYHSTIANECNNPNTDQEVSRDPVAAEYPPHMYPDKALDPANKPDITWQRQTAGRWEVLETPYNKGEYARVIIDELHAYDLAQVDPADRDATDGILYGWSTTLEGGPPPGVEHTYRFEAYAAGQQATGDVALHSGPTVIEIPVGGTTELLVDGSHSSLRPAEGSGSGSLPYAAIAGGAAAAAAVALTAGGWYARRRWLS